MEKEITLNYTITSESAVALKNVLRFVKVEIVDIVNDGTNTTLHLRARDGVSEREFDIIVSQLNHTKIDTPRKADDLLASIRSAFVNGTSKQETKGSSGSSSPYNTLKTLYGNLPKLDSFNSDSTKSTSDPESAKSSVLTKAMTFGAFLVLFVTILSSGISPATSALLASGATALIYYIIK